MLWGYIFLWAGLLIGISIVVVGFIYAFKRRNKGLPFAALLVGLVVGFAIASLSRLDPEYMAQLHHSKASLCNCTDFTSTPK